MVSVGRRLVISGRVQGVWFRARCAEEAERHGVRGWARNLDDGRVEVIAEGDAAAVAAIEEWCAEGPPLATVARVEAADHPPSGAAGFLIL